MTLESEIKKLVEIKTDIDKTVADGIKAVHNLKKIAYTLITLFGAAILYSVITTTRVDTKLINAEKDIEYVRSNAANKKSLDKLRDAIELNNQSVEKLVSDPDTKDALKYFNDGMKKILDEIVSWNSEIEPRGRVEDRANKNLTFNK